MCNKIVCYHILPFLFYVPCILKNLRIIVENNYFEGYEERLKLEVHLP